jgi:IclR family transcriptional regulator, KDG regulon repressor
MIQVVNRAIDIIEYVAKDASYPKPLGEMATALSLNTATCANIVKTLLNRGYLKKSKGSKGYLLGETLSEIVENAGNYRDLITAADTEMEEATGALKENTILAILQEDKRVIIHRKNAVQLVQANTADEKKACDTSSGRLLIAMMDDNAIEKYINDFGLPTVAIWKEAVTLKKFFEQVKIIRLKGFVLTEDSEQVTGVAVPVFKKGKMVAAFSIYMPSFRCNEKKIKEMIKSATLAAGKISEKLNQ